MKSSSLRSRSVHTMCAAPCGGDKGDTVDLLGPGEDGRPWQDAERKVACNLSLCTGHRQWGRPATLYSRWGGSLNDLCGGTDHIEHELGVGVDGAVVLGHDVPA